MAGRDINVVLASFLVPGSLCILECRRDLLASLLLPVDG